MRQCRVRPVRVQQPHRMGRASCGSDSRITSGIRAVESADTVKAETIGAVVGAMKDRRWRITSHRHACPLQPGAIFCALALKRTPKGNGNQVNEL